MSYDLQRASLWKRIAAGMFDWIMVGILAVGLAYLLSLALNYDSYATQLEAAYAHYEEAYGVRFQVTQEEYQSLSDIQRENYDRAYQALTGDEAAMYAYNMNINLMLVMTTMSILLAVLIWDFLIPLKLGHGRTLGKKIFGLCLMRSDSVAMNTMQLFARSLLGVFTLETMLPIILGLMIFWGIMDITGTLVLLALGLAQLLLCTFTKTHALLHDLLAGTVVVDYSSQMIFSSTEDLIAFQKKLAAERAARQIY